MPYKRDDSAYWWIIVGDARRSSKTASFEDAKALEAKLNHELWLATQMGLKRPRSWDDAVVKFLKESKHKASYDTIEQRLFWWNPLLRPVTDITKITRDMLDAYIVANRPVTGEPSSANTTANKYAIVVGSVLNAARDDWEWIDKSPKLRYYPEPAHRRVFLTVEDWTRLEAELPQHLLLPARFALATGLRAAKVFGLEWSQIDMKAKSLRTIGNDHKLGVSIPLNATAMSVLEDIRAMPVQFVKRVFTYNGKPLNDYGQAWFKALDRAGLGTLTTWKTQDGKKHIKWDGFMWHGLRHTFASWLGQAGTSDSVIDQLCGWAEKDTRGIYTHLDVEHLRRHAEVIDVKLNARFANSERTTG